MPCHACRNTPSSESSMIISGCARVQATTHLHLGISSSFHVMCVRGTIKGRITLRAVV